MGILDTIREDFDTARLTVAITDGEARVRVELRDGKVVVRSQR